MKTPVRTCVGCGAKKPKNEMIRVGIRDDVEIISTGADKLAGRGSYVCFDIECVKSAKKRGGLSRVLRRKVAERLYDELELLIKDRQKVSIG